MTEDFVIRGAQVCLPDGLRVTDVAVSEGKIAQLGDGVSAPEFVEAEGMLLLPGAIDPHVHYNEPGRTNWEGWATGSLASAAGGAACVFEMPLNAHPPTLDAESFDLKRRAAEASSVVDFGLWGGLTPCNLDKMRELGERGVIGFKAFLSSSGLDDFRRSDRETLRQGMKIAADLGLPVATHAENEEMVARLAAEAKSAGRGCNRGGFAPWYASDRAHRPPLRPPSRVRADRSRPPERHSRARVAHRIRPSPPISPAAPRCPR